MKTVHSMVCDFSSAIGDSDFIPEITIWLQKQNSIQSYGIVVMAVVLDGLKNHWALGNCDGHFPGFLCSSDLLSTE